MRCYRHTDVAEEIHYFIGVSEICSLFNITRYRFVIIIIIIIILSLANMYLVCETSGVPVRYRLKAVCQTCETFATTAGEQ